MRRLVTAARARPWMSLGLLLVALLLLNAGNAVYMASLQRDALLRLATPSASRFLVTTTPEAVNASFWALLKAAFGAVPALLVLPIVGRRVGVGARPVLAVALLAAFLVALNGGRLQSVLFGTGPLAAGAFDLDGLVVTPVIEELLKVAAVALAFRWVRPSLRAGIVLGAAAGVGMTLLETAHWITVSAILAAGADDWAIVALRFALAGFGLHATTTAISGGALGAWLGRGGHRVGRPGLVAAGLVVAMAIHGAWNAWAPGLIDAAVAPTLAAGRRPAPFDLFITASAVAAVLLAMPYLVLAIAWLRGRPSPRSDAPGATSGIERADGVSDGEPGDEPGEGPESGGESGGEPDGEGPEPGPAS